MGQFKPMTKMETTEPSVILKLKTGGHVNMKKGGSASCGHKAMGKADGGIMGALAETPSLVGRPAMAAPVQKIGKPSMSSRRKAMMAKPAAAPAGMPAMKKGGKMATGGVVSGNGGGYKTGGVADSNGGGYKKGGKTSKKAYAAGGTVNSGKPVAMPQGNKKPQPPVSISKLAGTYKKGGRATPEEARRMAGMRTPSDAGPISDAETKGYEDHYAREKADNEADAKAMHDMMMYLPNKAADLFHKLHGQGAITNAELGGQGAVTDAEKAVK